MERHVELPCAKCNKKLFFTPQQAKFLPVLDDRKLAFCSRKCNAAFVAEEGQRQQRLSRERSQENPFQ